MLLGRVARMYYEHGLTHQEIANALGLSRVRVTRLLAEARDSGLVEIVIHADESAFADEERALLERFGLRQAWISPAVPDEVKSERSFGAVGAEALGAMIGKDEVVGIGLSTAVSLALNAFTARPLGASFVPLTGSSGGLATGANPHEIALTLAARTGGRAFHLPAPLLAANASAARAATSEPGTAEVLGLARRAQLLVAGIGGMTAGEGILLRSLDEAERADLVARGAVGDLAGRFFDTDGAAVEGPLDERIIGLSLAEMASVPNRLVIARGASKVDALRVALAKGLVNMIVTDSATAEALLR